MRRDRFLIVTADDFGLHEAVNEAVQQASREGILTAASLMMGASATADAVRRARELPGLRVGLHLVLVDGVPLLPASEVPLLLDRSGQFGSRMVLHGARYFLSPRARRQLEAEIRAQFRAFAATGLMLDHVNAHKHFHLHPTLLTLLLRVGREYGIKAVRYPHEPARLLTGASLPERAAAAALKPWLLLMRRRLRNAGLIHNDQLFGMGRSGAIDEATLIDALRALPPGVTEIYLHPATRSGAAISASMSAYRHADELRALLSPRVGALLAESQTPRGGYSDWLRLLNARHAP
ncbi:MAG: hopanoid biosynthesis-associated protein HpnK [Steroidobacteraceae bacterium]|jgi:hopanoid biosynthesis associated protein HpnK